MPFIWEFKVFKPKNIEMITSENILLAKSPKSKVKELDWSAFYEVISISDILDLQIYEIASTFYFNNS